MRSRDAFRTEHDEVWELLPWLVNRTLAAHEASRAEAHVRLCLPCRAELERQVETASLLQAPEALPLSPARGLSRLEDRLSARAPERGRRWTGWGWLALAEAALIVVLLAASLGRGHAPAAPQPTFETLSDRPTAGARPNGPVYRVLFVERSSERQLRELLAELDLRVVDGPSPLGLFTLELANAQADADAVLTRLRAHRAIRFVERVDQGSAAQSH
jgi:hypothetical protein